MIKIWPILMRAKGRIKRKRKNNKKKLKLNNPEVINKNNNNKLSSLTNHTKEMGHLLKILKALKK